MYICKSVANALGMKKAEVYSAPIQFIEMKNNTFDIMNIRYRSDGTKTRNKWKLPPTTTDDWRFGVCIKSIYRVSWNWTDTNISIKLMGEHMSVRAMMEDYHQSVKWA